MSMAVSPITSPASISGVSAPTPPTAPTRPDGASFGDMVKSGLEQVSAAEQGADDLVQKMASGQSVQPHEVMIATSKATLSVEMLSQVRNKALDAYREVMNLQI